MRRMETDSEPALHSLFANYLRMKVKDGGFPKGCALPSIGEFMMVFKLTPAEVIKAVIELEGSGIAKVTARSVEIVAGREGVPLPVDVRNDIRMLFSELDSLENKALDDAWPKIDKDSIRFQLSIDDSVPPSKKIWRMNKALHDQIVNHCSDMTLCLKLETLLGNIRFFRRLYLDSIPSREVFKHALALENIIYAMSADDLPGAHSNVSSHIVQVRDALLEIFSQKNTLKGRRTVS